MSESENGGSVRITNADIYRELQTQGRSIMRLENRFTDVLKPSVDRNTAEIANLRDSKADKVETTKLEGTINSVRNQTYAIVSGVIAALIALRTLGVI